MNAPLPHHRQGQVVRVFVFLALDVRKGHAIVGGDDHECIVQQVLFFQQREHALQMRVEMLDLEGVVQQVRADGLIVRPLARDAIDLIEQLAPLLAARIELVTTVRLVPPVPEAERVALGPGGEEVGEVSRVVVATDRSGRGGQLAGLIRRARQMPRLAIPLARDARRPALAREADVIVLLAQHLGVGLELGGEIAPVIGRRFELPGVAPGQNAGPRRRALGVRRIRIGKEHPRASHAVERGRLHPGASVRAHMGPRGIVRNAEENVGPRPRLADCCRNDRRPRRQYQRSTHRFQKGSPRYLCPFHRHRLLYRFSIHSYRPAYGSDTASASRRPPLMIPNPGPSASRCLRMGYKWRDIPRQEAGYFTGKWKARARDVTARRPQDRIMTAGGNACVPLDSY